MKIGIMQPYFLPYVGYFQLIKAVDKYIIYDDVNFITRGYINRNNMLVNSERKLFTIKLKGASHNKLINEIEVGDDFRKFLKTVQYNYFKAPFYKDVFPVIQQITQFEDKCLSQFIANSIKEICCYLDIDTSILMSSELSKDCSLKGKDKIINICKCLGAYMYINSIGGKELYDKDEFAFHGIDLKFLNTEIIPYQQFRNEFISNLSILDVLMFNPVKKVNEMLTNFDLI